MYIKVVMCVYVFNVLIWMKSAAFCKRRFSFFLVVVFSTLFWINDVYLCVSAERVTSLGKDWHRPCLKCEKCNKTLSSGSHAEVSFRKCTTIPLPDRDVKFGTRSPDINTSGGYAVRVLWTPFKSINVLWTDKCVLPHSTKGSPIVTTHATLRSLDPKVSHQSAMCQSRGWLLRFTVLYGYPFTKASHDEFQWLLHKLLGAGVGQSVVDYYKTAYICSV